METEGKMQKMMFMLPAEYEHHFLHLPLGLHYNRRGHGDRLGLLRVLLHDDGRCHGYARRSLVLRRAEYADVSRERSEGRPVSLAGVCDGGGESLSVFAHLVRSFDILALEDDVEVWFRH